jgi:hypothetical protein
MKLHLMPEEPTWWVWIATALLIFAGFFGIPAAFVAAIVLSVIQSAIVLGLRRSFRPYPVQIRLAYTLFMIVSFVPALRWFYWALGLGALALVIFGYCIMARFLSLMPWNRTQPFTMRLLARTFLTAPVMGRADHGLPFGNPDAGVCELEAEAGRELDVAP